MPTMPETASLFDVADHSLATKVRSRAHPIDMIFTIRSDGRGLCCWACKMGWTWGIQSGYPVCRYADEDWHKLLFIDNDWKAYSHKVHMADVAKYRPKYATVCDYLGRERVEQLNRGIDEKNAHAKVWNADLRRGEVDGKPEPILPYYTFEPLEQVLDWAAEAAEHAENVIVIPKPDPDDTERIVARVPEEYVLGYSVPTTHGGRSTPWSAFAGRRVHMLGGPWKQQMRELDRLLSAGADVVSIDNNYIWKQAQYGHYTLPNGDAVDLNDTVARVRKKVSGHEFTEDTPLAGVKNTAYLAVMLSLGFIGAAVAEWWEERDA